MKQLIPVPQVEKTEKILQAWENIDFYLCGETSRITDLFMMCGTYRTFSFAMSFLGIQGWPVSAIWDDLKETVRSNHS